MSARRRVRFGKILRLAEYLMKVAGRKNGNPFCQICFKLHQRRLRIGRGNPLAGIGGAPPDLKTK